MRQDFVWNEAKIEHHPITSTTCSTTTSYTTSLLLPSTQITAAEGEQCLVLGEESPPWASLKTKPSPAAVSHVAVEVRAHRPTKTRVDAEANILLVRISK